MERDIDHSVVPMGSSIPPWGIPGNFFYQRPHPSSGNIEEGVSHHLEGKKSRY